MDSLITATGGLLGLSDSVNKRPFTSEIPSVRWKLGVTPAKNAVVSDFSPISTRPSGVITMSHRLIKGSPVAAAADFTFGRDCERSINSL